MGLLFIQILNKNILKNKSIAKIILNRNQIINITRSNIKSKEKVYIIMDWYF